MDRSDPGADAKKTRRIAKLTAPVDDPLAAFKESLGVAAVQMLRYQIVGMLKSFVSNRANEFASHVRCSSLDARTKTILHVINRSKRWFDPVERMVLWLHPTAAEAALIEAGDLETDAKGRVAMVVPKHVRRLARTIMRHVLARHRKPSMRRIGMVLDGRVATMEQATTSTHADHWLRLAFPRRPLLFLPVRATRRWLHRSGKRSNTFQVGIDREGRVAIANACDMGEEFASDRERYAAKTDFTALDFGLRTLFATDRGDLLGRDFLSELKRFDRTITGIARHRQRSGGKPRDSERYRLWVRRLRDYVTMEVNRCLNRVVALHAPALLVVEALDFRNSELSARLNRIVRNCGRAAVAAKLAQLEETKGVRHERVPAAYSSRECRLCSYVDPRNRNGDEFKCRWCGHKMHADVHAAKVIGSRRSRFELEPERQVWDTKAAVLDRAVTRHFERHEGRPGPSPDPRDGNRYYREWRGARSRTTMDETVGMIVSTSKSG